MVRLFASAEVAVSPSIFEGFGFPAVEAMACGVPLVAAEGGALPLNWAPHELAHSVRHADRLATVLDVERIPCGGWDVVPVELPHIGHQLLCDVGI